MKLLLRNIRAESLLATGGCIIFLVFGWMLFSAHLAGEQKNYDAVSMADERLTENMSDFEKAEFYFNAGDDPSGSYDLKKARALYSNVIMASSTSHALAWYQLGRIDFIEGKFDAAIYKFEKQISYFGDTVPSVHYMLGLTYAYRAQKTHADSNWLHAEEEFTRFLTIKPESPWARTDLSWVYFSQGKYEEMLPVLAEGLGQTPDSPWLHNMYGLALMNTGDRESAKVHFEKAYEGAKALTIAEWGLAYPGNNPQQWKTGLDSFIYAIETNLTLVSK